ncbi:acyl-CoA N-acyltransferase [Auriculariales sp. MPI-PUGE-AT-0066]|nr:acyl-CoA N-acyltransferase [Auriculariales sp. MPI-PUGE-AT-0066]
MSFVLPSKDLQNDRVRLVQFDPTVHIPLLFKEHQVNPELYRYFAAPPGLMASEAALHMWYDKGVAKEPTRTLWAVFDVDTGDFAGCIGVFYVDVANKTAEIGTVTVAKRWHRTHVNTNICGLVLRFCFDDLNVRRLQWQTNVENVASINAAQRLGFRLEGVMRWQRVLPLGCEGLTRPGEEGPGRHTAMLAVCWDDWESEGFQAELQAKMNRRV